MVARHQRFSTALVFTTVLVVASSAAAQHDAGVDQSPEHQHDSADTAALLRAREGSGTSWQPDRTPMHGLHGEWRGWQGMLHGNLILQFVYEPAERHRSGGIAARQVSGVNWIMGMARRPLAGGRAGVRAMLSAEPWTVSDCGFLNFLATGEMCEGDTIHDRQHPHDVWMELAADYERPIAGSLRWHVYGGLSGEPALGPGGFPHRLSAIANPLAPITHHWLDATHISFGLITAGVSDRRWRAEASIFNGREPDERRTDVDWGALDSFAGRLSWLPNERLAVQVSAGHLDEAEAEFPPSPRTDVDRLTASAAYHRPAHGGTWATTLAWGMNSGTELLPEGTAALTTHAAEFGAVVFTFGKVQGGYMRSASWRGVTAGLGATAFASLVPPAFVPHYGGRVAPGVGVFLNVALGGGR